MARHGWLRRFLKDAEDDPATQIRIHKWFIRFWLWNIPVALAVFFAFPDVWQQVSILYVLILSLYANFATDYDALSASQASQHALEARDRSEGKGD